MFSFEVNSGININPVEFVLG